MKLINQSIHLLIILPMLLSCSVLPEQEEWYAKIVSQWQGHFYSILSNQA